jgi:hypothetical protein
VRFVDRGLAVFDCDTGLARAIADMALARSDNGSQRFYSMSTQIRIERNACWTAREAHEMLPGYGST